MVIDVHAHLHTTPNQTNDREEGEKLLQTVQRHGIARMYISSVGSYYPTEDEVDVCNRGIYRFCRQYPQVMRGYCYLNPKLPNTIETLRRGVEDNNVKGVKLWVATYCDDASVDPVVEKCIEYDIPILIHAYHKFIGQLPDETRGIHVAHLAARYPESRLIMAHNGGNVYSDIKEVRQYKNVCTDISGSNYRRGELDYAVKILGADRVLFGTDMSGMPFVTNLGIVQDAALSDADKECVLWKNACRVFKEEV